MQKPTPAEWLKIDIASNFSGKIEKSNWQARIDWFDQNEAAIFAEPMEYTKLADDPALFYAGLQAYDDAVNQGKEIGYPVSLDACSSGLQILACLIGCEKSASICGVIDTGERENAYESIYHTMLNKLPEEERPVVSLDYDDVKQAIMTSLYNSTAEPKRVFGEGALLRLFYETMEETVPGAWQLNQSFQSLWNSAALEHHWELPDGFNVHVKVMDTVQKTVQFRNAPYAVNVRMNQPMKESRSLSPNIVHSVDGMVVREIIRRCSFDAGVIVDVVRNLGAKGTNATTPKGKTVKRLWDLYLASGFLSTRILDNLDETNMGLVDPVYIASMIKTFPSRPFSVITIHDCFRVLPHYANDLRQQYNHVLAQITQSKMLDHIATQLSGRKVTANKMGMSALDVLEADYALS